MRRQQRRIGIERRTPHHLQSMRCDQRRHRIETLRMTRHDEQQRIDRNRLERSQDQFLFAIPGAGAQQHPARAEPPAPCRAEDKLFFRRQHVELDAAGNRHRGHAEPLQPGRIRRRLRTCPRQPPRRRTDQPAQAFTARKRAGRQARIDQHYRNAVPVAARHQIRPDLGFDQQARLRPIVAQQPTDHPAGIVRQVALHHSRAMPGEQRLAGGASGGRHVGQQDAMSRPRIEKRFDQWCGGAGFTDRHRMYPDNWRGVGRLRCAVKTETLGHMPPVAPLLAAAPPQPRSHQRHRQPPGKRVEAADHGWRGRGLRFR